MYKWLQCSKKTLFPIIDEKVRKGLIVITDDLNVYGTLCENNEHKVITYGRHIHAVDGYHTNSIEGFWSHTKRGQKVFTICQSEAFAEVLQGIRFSLQYKNADRFRLFQRILGKFYGKSVLRRTFDETRMEGYRIIQIQTNKKVQSCSCMVGFLCLQLIYVGLCS